MSTRSHRVSSERRGQGLPRPPLHTDPGDRVLRGLPAASGVIQDARSTSKKQRTHLGGDWFLFPNWWNRWRLQAVMYSLDGNNDLQTFTLYPGIWDRPGQKEQGRRNTPRPGEPRAAAERGACAGQRAP